MTARTLMTASLTAVALAAAAEADQTEQTVIAFRDEEARRATGLELAFREDDRPMPAPKRAGDLDFGPRVYVEGGISVFNFRAENSATESAGTLRGGVAFNRLFALEVDYSQLIDASSFVVESSTGEPGGGTALREPDRVSTAFARVVWPLSGRLSAHARAGFARLDAEDETGSDATSDGAAFGAGLSLPLLETVGLRADYTRMQLDDADADVGTMTFTVRF